MDKIELAEKKLEDLDKNELIKEIEELRKQNKTLEDELESLWLMLDELSESDIANWSHMLDQLEVEIAQKTLIRGMPIDKIVDCE